MKAKRQYFALHKDGLRNGSFYRVTPFGRSASSVAQYINGDYMGALQELPKTYAGQPLVEFDADTAERSCYQLAASRDDNTMKHPKIPQSEVLQWLQDNHISLAGHAEVERDWVWLVVDLRGDHNKATRESIKEFGFVFHRHGGHKLPSGNIGTWGHSCDKPMRFRRGKGNTNNTGNNTATTERQLSDDEILAMFG